MIKIIVNKPENKAIMTLVSDIDEDISYALNFLYEEYTGSKLTYSEIDLGNGVKATKETEDRYYTRYYFDCNLNLINDSSSPSQTPDSGVYKIIEGANSSWVQNSDETLNFRINGDLSKFVGIKVDDEWVDKENYVADAGSTIVTLKNEYLKTLSVGEHKITFIYMDGEAGTNFEVKESGKIYKNSNNSKTGEIYENSDISDPNIPKTGDNISVNFWLISALGMLMLALYNRKKKYTI